MNIKSFAKINFGLQVLNKREDNFHNINTIFAKIDLFDELIITESDKLEVYSDIDLGIEMEENLVYQAAEKLQRRLRISDGARIDIKKNIPAGGGLGGGSSNAAYALKALLKHWSSGGRIKEPEIVAKTIGSDVPFFLDQGFAVGRSRGEQLEYFQAEPNFYVLIVNPGIHVNTAAAYKSLNRTDKPRPILNYKSLFSRALDNISLFREYFINDFEKPVFEMHPVLNNIKSELYKHGSFYSAMSGSGSTMFGFFEKLDSAQNSQRQFNNYFTKICNFVS